MEIPVGGVVGDDLLQICYKAAVETFGDPVALEAESVSEVMVSLNFFQKASNNAF